MHSCVATSISSLILCAAAHGQRMVADLSPGLEPAPLSLQLLGVAGTHGILRVENQLWSTDGTTNGTRLLTEFPPLALPFGGATVGNRLLMPTILPQGNGLWQSDGVSHGLVTPISPARVGTSLSDLVSLGNVAVFAAQEDVHGTELWITDGTAAGTRVLRDIRPGVEGSWPWELKRSGNLVFFLADDGVLGRELWRTDGTAVGTFMIGELVPGPGGVSGLAQMVSVAGGLVFPFGNGLWFTDGSRGMLVQGVTLPATASSFAPLGGRILFQVGADLWATDGPAAGARLVRSFQGLILLRRGRQAYDAPVELAGRLLFLASDGVTGFELWTSDGTPAGTRLVVDIAPGALSSWAEPLFWEAGRAWFLADGGGPEGQELWLTDGTAGGTRLIADMTPGRGGSRVEQVLSVAGFRLLAVGDGSGGAVRVWRVDANTPQQVIAPLAPARSSRVFACASAGEDVALRFEASTGTEVARVLPSGALTRLGPGDRLAANEGDIGFLRGRDLVVQAPGASARVVHTFGSDPFVVAGANRRWFVSLWTGANGEVWVSDGTATGTSLLQIGMFQQAVPFGRLTLLSSEGGLYLTDGTAAGTSFLAVSTTGVPTGLSPFGGEVLFTVDQRDLWATDGSQAGTRRLATLQAGTAPIRFAVGTRRGFALTRTALIVTDGTAAGTRTVRTFTHANEDDLVVIDDRAFFTAAEALTGDELWVSDGTATGTIELDLWPGPSSSTPRELAAIGDRVAFAASDPVAGRELWVSDGTLAGSGRVADLRAGLLGSAPARIVRAGATVYFMADDGVSGSEPWLAPLRFFGAAAVDVLPGACAGSQGLPRLTSGYARLGDAGFGLTIDRARASAPGVLLIGTNRAAVQVGSCALRVAPLVSFGIQADAAGRATLGVPVPTTPSLLGQSFTWQAIIADPAGALFGLASVTDAVRTVIGR